MSKKMGSRVDQWCGYIQKIGSIIERRYYRYILKFESITKKKCQWELCYRVV